MSKLLQYMNATHTQLLDIRSLQILLTICGSMLPSACATMTNTGLCSDMTVAKSGVHVKSDMHELVMSLAASCLAS